MNRITTLEGFAASDPLWLDESAELHSVLGHVSKYPELRFAPKDVRRAGARLAGVLHWGPAARVETLEAFAIANSWRDSHIYPMRSVRYSVLHRMRHRDIPGYTAARPKRISSIRTKLRRLTVNLEQINDIAGCRAVLDDISAVNELIAVCSSDFPHIIRQQYPYIRRPKPSGYRSHHIVFDFCGKDDTEVFNGRRIELQIRTRLQHSWATAVEAVGLYRGEDMKAGEGDHDWLRLFYLISVEFAYSEGCDVSFCGLDRLQRLREIRALNDKLGAAKVLEDLRNATHYLQNFVQPHSRYYMIHYDNVTKEVDVIGFSGIMEAVASLAFQEQRIESGAEDAKVVLVEVDKVAKLIEAYPNYFGDVALFIRNLKAICEGKPAVEYTMAPQQVVAPKPYEKPDFAAIRRRYRRWT